MVTQLDQVLLKADIGVHVLLIATGVGSMIVILQILFGDDRDRFPAESPLGCLGEGDVVMALPLVIFLDLQSHIFEPFLGHV